MKIILLTMLTLLISCSTKWMDKFIREDHDKINVSYARLAPTKLLPVPKYDICLEVKGMTPDTLLQNLNGRALFNFKKCSPALITVTFSAQNDAAMAKSENAAELKNMGSKAKGGNTLLGMLLLSSIQTEVPVVKAAGSVTIKSKTEEVSYQYETQYFDSHYVKSDQNKNGNIYLEVEVLKLVSTQIWSVIAPVWKYESAILSFDINKDYYEDFKWNLHHEDYQRALVSLDLLVKEKSSLDLYYNRGVIYEYFRDYKKALSDYDMAKKIDDIQRVKKEIIYLDGIKKINDSLLSLR
jgi:tetratricopeptide (TPR) repeat protein